MKCVNLHWLEGDNRCLLYGCCVVQQRQWRRLNSFSEVVDEEAIDAESAARRGPIQTGGW